MEIVLLDRTDQQDLGANESSPETAGAHAVEVTDAGLRRHEMEGRPSRESHSLRMQSPTNPGNQTVKSQRNGRDPAGGETSVV